MGGAINTNSTFGSSNFDGNIQSKVSANTTAGISIVRYTGNGSNKQYTRAWFRWCFKSNLAKRFINSWHCNTYLQFIISSGYGLYFNNDNAKDNANDSYDKSRHHHFSFNANGGNDRINENDNICYCFTSEQDFLVLETYKGNNNV